MTQGRAATQQIDLVIVGLGQQGQRHARVAASTGAARVVATVDVRASGLDGIPHFATIDDALGSGIGATRPLGAVVSTPAGDHLESTARLLTAGVPVLVEKPITRTPDEAQLLEAVANSSASLLAVGHVERFNPCVQMVGRMVREGLFGTPIACTFRRVGLAPPTRPDSDVIHDLGVHDIDVFGLLMGETPELLGAAGWVGPSSLIESAHILLGTRATNGFIEVNWRTPVRMRGFTITSDTCLVEANYTTQSVQVVEASEERELESFPEFRQHYGASKRTVLEPRIAEPLAEQMRAFAAAVTTGDAGLLASATDGRRSLDIASQAVDRILGGVGV